MTLSGAKGHSYNNPRTWLRGMILTMNFLFFRWRIPKNLPPEIQTVCDELAALTDQESVVRRAHEILSTRFRARKYLTYPLLWKIFDRDLSRIWSRTSFLHCTHMNWLLKIVLVRSGHFVEADVREKWTFLTVISPHQYAKVRMHDGQWINVDVWGSTYGIPFGNYAHGFMLRYAQHDKKPQ